MTVKSRSKTAIGGIAPALFAAAGLALAVPAAGLAVTGMQNGAAKSPSAEFSLFTPASVDPQLARRVAASVQAKGQAVRFTPASGTSAKDRTYTVAVRVDDQTARAISVRAAISGATGAQGLSDAAGRLAALAPTRYNLGAARGYQGFAKTPSLAKPDISSSAALSLKAVGRNKIGLRDLADFRPAEGSAIDKPSRFQPRIAMETEKGTVGRAEGTLESLGEQTVDLGGAYRVTRNLNVTAGVRLSQDRDRLAPLTDSVQDSQAVYVGTQFRF